MIAIPYKSKQFFFVLIKLAIVMLAFGYMSHRLIHNSPAELYNLKDIYNYDILGLSVFISSLVILSCFNWCFEIAKWKLLVAPFKKIQLEESFKQCLASLTASIFTPNRIGEYGAKALFFVSKDRKRIVFANFIGNMLQLTTTMLFGSIGLFFFTKQKDNLVDTNGLIYIIPTLLFSMAIAHLLWKQNRIHSIISFKKKLKKLYGHYPKNILWKTLLFCSARYAIFSFQFYVILYALGANIDYWSAMTSITTLYLVTSIIPNMVLLDVVVKGGAAIYLFSIWGVDELTILSSVTIMWLFNFVIPSIVGSFFVLNFKLKKGYASS